MSLIVQVFGHVQISPGRSDSFNLEIPVDLDTATIADLKKHALLKAASIHQKATLLGMYVGEEKLNGTQQEDSMLLKDIPKFHVQKEIICNFELSSSNSVSDDVITATGALVGAVAGPVAVQSAITAAGFGAGGIVAGTPAAALMASYGGSVGAGTACAVLQSIGAVGLGVGGGMVAAGVGGFLLYAGIHSLLSRH